MGQFIAPNIDPVTVLSNDRHLSMTMSTDQSQKMKKPDLV